VAIVLAHPDHAVKRVVAAMGRGHRHVALEVFFQDLIHHPDIHDEERSFLANWVGAHDEAECHLLDRDDL